MAARAALHPRNARLWFARARSREPSGRPRDRGSSSAASPGAPSSSVGVWWLVGAPVIWNLVNLRAETFSAAYADDGSMHDQMVRFAAIQLHHGVLPLTSWVPFLGLGSPQFMHYQSLPAMLTGLVGLVVGPNVAFRWSLYLLLSLWPVSVYLGARAFGLGRWAAAAAAAMSPFLVSAVGIGYEQRAYVWLGFGVWTQLWASMTLPLAWGWGWRAIRDGRHLTIAVAFVSITIAFHFETGYLAVLPLLFWPFVAGASLRRAVSRGVALVIGSLMTIAWVVVPVAVNSAWTSTNEILAGTPLANGYGLGRVAGWLVTGELLDHGRLPVISLFACAGLAVCVGRSRTDPNARALLVCLAACVLLASGRATFGPLADLIPGSPDLFFRRFMMGVQLAALLLAGVGAASCGRVLGQAIAEWRLRSRTRLFWGWLSVARRGWAFGVVALSLVLTPAWLQLGAFDQHLGVAIAAQRRADVTQGAALDRLVAIIRGRGGGRVYAGLPSNWGAKFRVGKVPVFKYLDSRDVDEVGYTLRTASLMTDPEFFFDEHNVSDYDLFAIRYILLPSWRKPPVPARSLARSGPYSLWHTSITGYMRSGEVIGRLTATRTNIGIRSIPLLHSHLTENGEYLRVAFGRTDVAPPPLPSGRSSHFADSVEGDSDSLARGNVSGTVRMSHAGVVILSASYDPGWRVDIDGHPRSPILAAPALPAVLVPAGTHRIRFYYNGFADYPELFSLGVVSMAALLMADIALARRKLRPRYGQHQREVQ